VSSVDLEMVRDFVKRYGLSAYPDSAVATAVPGGVSSDLWRVELPEQVICIKRALPTLRVVDEWHAPVSRNAIEWAWLEMAAHYRPSNVPKLLAHDEGGGLIAMEYLPHPVWKAELIAGRVDPTFAANVGTVLGDFHQASAADPRLREAFATEANFDALRLEPYLRVTARRHPRVASRLLALADRTAKTNFAVVHGDVSPKNILVATTGPVFLDAECAWFGDPAFDVAFCLTHLLLKTLVRPDHTEDLRHSADAFLTSHASHVEWEPLHAFDIRVATLLPALLLARVDGASPVEYLSNPAQQLVREFSIAMLIEDPGSTPLLIDRWGDVVAHWITQSAAGRATTPQALRPRSDSHND
jgi:tRNA A-37 threonylcarbamoyl transferase component Bud32